MKNPLSEIVDGFVNPPKRPDDIHSFKAVRAIIMIVSLGFFIGGIVAAQCYDSMFSYPLMCFALAANAFANILADKMIQRLE